MILCDSSVWIDYFAGRGTLQTDKLDAHLSAELVYCGDLIMVEVLQGIRKAGDLSIVSSGFAQLEKVTLCGPQIAPIAAANYRSLRQRGITVRGTIDVIIATWCAENDVPLLHNDRDFAVLEAAMGLKAA